MDDFGRLRGGHGTLIVEHIDLGLLFVGLGDEMLRLFAATAHEVLNFKLFSLHVVRDGLRGRFLHQATFAFELIGRAAPFIILSSDDAFSPFHSIRGPIHWLVVEIRAILGVHLTSFDGLVAR